MCFNHIQWALNQKVNAGAKIVLISLANFSCKDGFCFPSVDKISEITGQCEKTVRVKLDYLVGLKFIRKVYRKRRKNGQLSVYQYQLLTNGKVGRKYNKKVVKHTARLTVKDTAHNLSESKNKKIKKLHHSNGLVKFSDFNGSFKEYQNYLNQSGHGIEPTNQEKEN